MILNPVRLMLWGFNSNVCKHLFLGEPHLGRACRLVSRGTITNGGDDGARVTLGLQTEDLVVLPAVEAFHRTSINAEQRGAGEEIAKRDISLVPRPGGAGSLIH